MAEKFLSPRYFLQNTVLFLLLLVLQNTVEKVFFIKGTFQEHIQLSGFALLLNYDIRVCIKRLLTLLAEQKQLSCWLLKKREKKVLR